MSVLDRTFFEAELKRMEMDENLMKIDRNGRRKCDRSSEADENICGNMKMLGQIIGE